MIKLSSNIRRVRFQIYLGSLFLFLFAQLIPFPNNEAAWQHIIVVQNVLAGMLLFYNAPNWKQIFVIFLAGVMLFECFLLFKFNGNAIRSTLGILFIVYFMMAGYELMKVLLKTKVVTKEILAATFSGFIMIGITGGFVYTLIEIFNPGSFTNIGIGEDRFENLSYFSFISLLTIGYGDIIPFTFVAKKAALFMGLAGHFYLTVISAIIIGKFLNQS